MAGVSFFVQVTVYRVVEFGEGIQTPEDTKPDPAICREVRQGRIQDFQKEDAQMINLCA